jgi:hypothetical protein
MHWEYRLEVARFDEFAKFTKHLNELGRHGWEAVGITGNADADDLTVLLKRESKTVARVGDVDVQVGMPDPRGIRDAEA